MSLKKIFIILFAILYTCVMGVSLFHAISFFGLANNHFLSVILATAFEIGQATVLFSILTNNGGKNKFIPWLLMIILTAVQIMGNVFSSYEYLMINAGESLRYVKEPIFMWSNLQDSQCNVILSYLIGGILPLVALLLTSMVTNYIGNNDKPEVTINKEDTEYVPVNETTDIVKPTENLEKESHFVNI